MYRTAIEQLYAWKAQKNRKPLIICGARQVGKTWLMQEFGRTAYQHMIYINFDNNIRMHTLFSADFEARRILDGIELYSGQKINPENTLLVFDEIQETPKALSMLKYFNENAPEYQIICAGSLLGIALHKNTSFPVGKVDFLDIYPLSFTEFMTAMSAERFVDALKSNAFDLTTAFKQTYIDWLKQYYFVGGMPEVVVNFAENRDFSEAQKIQQRILDSYEQDFSKHAPNDVVPRIRMLWNSIPAQLAKENKKFIYGLIKNGSRAKDYEAALLWLCDCGLIHQVYRVNAPNLPLKAYVDLKAFKLFVSDVGLLSCMTQLRPQTLLDGNDLFKEFKGALTEQFVFQQLLTLKNISVYYWANDRNSAEIDFVMDNGCDIIPIEVKAETNLQAKSLKSYRDQFSQHIAVRTSMADYKYDDGLVNLPLYAIERINEICSELKSASR